MVKAIVSLLMGSMIFAATAQAEEVRIGSATVQTGDHGYFDTYPGSFEGIKAIRIVKKGSNEPVSFGRVYFSFAPNQPWIYSAYTQVQSGWTPVPQMGALNRVRVYFDARPKFSNDNYVQTHFITVIGVR